MAHIPFSIITLLTHIFNVIISLILLVSIVKEAKKLLNSSLDFLILRLLTSGLLVAIGYLFVEGFNLTLGYLSKEICNLSAVLSILGLGSTIAIHAVISFERYFKIVKADISQKRKSTFITFLVVVCILILLSGVIVGVQSEAFVPMESGIWCFVDLTSTENVSQFLIWITLAFTTSNMIAIGFCYFSIYIKIVKEKQSTGRILGTNDVYSIANRLLMIFLSFCVTYSPTFVLFMYKYIAKRKVSPELELACSLIAGLEVGFTSLLIIYLNDHYREAVKTVFWSRFTNNITSTTTNGSIGTASVQLKNLEK